MSQYWHPSKMFWQRQRKQKAALLIVVVGVSATAEHDEVDVHSTLSSCLQLSAGESGNFMALNMEGGALESELCDVVASWLVCKKPIPEGWNGTTNPMYETMPFKLFPVTY